jgi:LmbE family N-acetylglucosaminyl deacetylase
MRGHAPPGVLNMENLTRRELLVGTGMLVAGGLTAAADAQTEPMAKGKLRILVAGAHPDDPESGCGGTIARYVDEGHSVVILYLTRGEAGIRGKSHDEAAAIRTAEAKKACEILKARPVFAGQIDGSTEVNAQRYDEIRKLIDVESPDVIFTQWPIDTHRDHRACSLLAYDAWLRLGRKAALYYYEVDLGAQTQCFRPTHFVDITAVEPTKRAACFAHESQGASTDFYPKFHAKMQQFRGMEGGFALAEAFVHHDQSPPGRLPRA